MKEEWAKTPRSVVIGYMPKGVPGTTVKIGGAKSVLKLTSSIGPDTFQLLKTHIEEVTTKADKFKDEIAEFLEYRKKGIAEFQLPKDKKLPEDIVYVERLILKYPNRDNRKLEAFRAKLATNDNYLRMIVFHLIGDYQKRDRNQDIQVSLTNFH